LGIGKEKLHIGAMYTKVDGLDTTGFDKMGVSNKEIVIDNHDQKLVPKIRGQRSDYKNGINKCQVLNGITQKWLQKKGYQKSLRKNNYQE
jgi:hypothetical protein